MLLQFSTPFHPLFILLRGLTLRLLLGSIAILSLGISALATANTEPRSPTACANGTENSPAPL